MLLGRDRLRRFRGIDMAISIPTIGAARKALDAKLQEQAAKPDESYYQGDEVGTAVDFFAPRVDPGKLHPTFKRLISDEKLSPAREIIAAMMRYHEDVDGNFVEQFQTTGFDARLWELYLFAVLNEAGYGRITGSEIPDLIGSGLLGEMGIEAVTANPPQSGKTPALTSKDELNDYIQNYIPLKLAKGLTRKLRHKRPYWREPAMNGVPFLIGIQDFHAPGSMKMIVPAATEYVFGYRHSREGSKTKIDKIAEHRVGESAEPSGFFNLGDAGNVSAVVVNPQGTLMKFNRMGLLAGFGSPRVKMRRTGILRREGKPGGPEPQPFVQDVTPESHESWIEGMVVLHNPRAQIPLEPHQLPGANHEFVRSDGRILSLLPEFHPYFSETSIWLPEDEAEKVTEE